MINSRQIEASIQRVKDWANEKYGNCPYIYVKGNDDDYSIIINYSSDNKEIDETISNQLSEDGLMQFLNGDDIKECITKLYEIEERKLSDIELMMIGANRFQFCSWNFEIADKPYEWTGVDGEVHHEYFPRFIMEVEWTCSRQHMMEKWRAATDIRNTDAYFPRFYAELDGTNRAAMLRWIMENYTSEQKLSL